MGINETAQKIGQYTDISSDAKLADSVSVGNFTTIQANVEIGEGSWIGPNVTIMEGARIGKHCRIFPGAVIAAVPQDLKFDGEETAVEIGDHTTIREYVTINRGTKDRWKTKIGSNCLLMAYVHIGHDTFVGNNCIIANSGTIAGHVTLDDWVVMEGLVAVQQFVHVGQHAFLGGASLVRKNVPPFIKAAREPLSFAGVNAIGLRRRGFSSEEITNIEDVYRTIYVHNTNITQAIKVADLELPNTDVKATILDFIRNSDKGIIRGPL